MSRKNQAVVVSQTKRIEALSMRGVPFVSSEGPARFLLDVFNYEDSFRQLPGRLEQIELDIDRLQSLMGAIVDALPEDTTVRFLHALGFRQVTVDGQLMSDPPSQPEDKQDEETNAPSPAIGEAASATLARPSDDSSSPAPSN